MFGAGWTEMLIIGIVALVVIGPKDLPVVMRKLGRVVRTVRRMGEEFQSELSKTTGLDQITDLKRSITEPLRQTSDEIMREFNRQTSTGIEPTGIVKPTDPAVESVYDQIAATSGLPPAAPSATAEAEPSPAPAETIPSKPRRARKAATSAVPAETPSPAVTPRARPRKAAAVAANVQPAPAPPVAATPKRTARKAKPAAPPRTAAKKA